MALDPTAPKIPLDGTGERMARLVASFPCLRAVEAAHPFDARKLARFLMADPLLPAAQRTDPLQIERHTAAEFLVWLWYEGLLEAGFVQGRVPDFLPERQAHERFSLITVAFYGSPETRAAVAAWLADPWLPCAAR